MSKGLTTPNTLLGTVQPHNRTARHLLNALAVLLGVLLIALASKVNIPVWPVPTTLQSFLVAIIAAAFGWRLGSLTLVLYVLAGAIGLPVFATGSGVDYFIGPTSGFLIGFVLQALITGYASDRGAASRPFALLGAMLLGNLVVLVVGVLWLIVHAASAQWIDQNNVWGSTFAKAVQPFVIWDMLKMAVAAMLMSGLWGLIIAPRKAASA